MSLQLNLPAPLLPASLQATLHALQALAHVPADAAQQLAILWQDSNRSALDGDGHLALFGHFQQALTRILPALENDYRLRDLSANVRARTAAALARHLQLERLLTLKLCLQQAEASPAALQLRLLQSTLDACHDVLATHMASYHPLPAMFWRDSHQLYQYACHQGHGDDAALATRYKALLLLGLCNSNRLSPTQIARLVELSTSAATQLQLNTPEAGGEGFFVSVDADQPPGYHTEPPEGSRMLDTRPLIDTLKQQLQLLSHRAPGAATEDGELFQALLHDWQRPAGRHEARIKMGGTLTLVSTLPACWHHMNGGSWSFAPTGDSSEELSYRSQLARRSPPPAPAAMSITNRSCDGMQLAGSNRGHPLRAGELVILREQGQSAWQCALLHWVHYGDALDTRCGLELLHGQLQAVMTRFDHANPGDTSTLALKLSPADAAPLLLLAGRPYQRLAGMTLISDAASERVRLLRVVKQMPHFQLIEVRPVSLR